MTHKLRIILGPTAVGKTDYSIREALEYGSPVISCDSRQIYKEMSVGTAVPSDEQLSAVKHYFIRTHHVSDLYSAGRYETEALSLVEHLFSMGHETLVMSGGSGFYIDAIKYGIFFQFVCQWELSSKIILKKGVLISILKIPRYVRAAEPQNRPLCFPDFVQ